MPQPSSPRDSDYVPTDREDVDKKESEDSHSDELLHGYSPPPSPNDEDAPITQTDLKALNEKLDSIIASSTVSSSQAYSEAAVKEINMAATTNASNANDAIFNLNASIRKEQESIEKLQANNSVDNSAFQTSISSRFS
ncbi:unnamed protein product [Lactuca saligna]|uniref:Uncharacterized protein n=1 Tax=Lactuca saligna TaxID=75948 RepID=A0AA35VG59_LACSI|nr:unnamed protein product [Lactuca saligna]